MTTNSTRATRLVRVAYFNCYSATLFTADVQMCHEHELRLSRLLCWLQDAGALLLPQPAADGADTFDGVVAHLCSTLGTPFVEAGMAADAACPPTSGGAPPAVMPIWRFEPAGEDPGDCDVLQSSGRLWGSDVLIEALKVGGPDHPVPVPAVRPRFDCWVRAGGGGRLRVAVQPPGRDGWYVLGAISAPA
jgi:hypothetical protein